MAACSYCGTETELRESNSPICVQCADLSAEKRAVRSRLFRDLHEAIKLAELANENFALAINASKFTNPPDGTQLIDNASRRLAAARTEMMTAHNRLNEFLNSGTVPGDLKRNR
ncbi:MAG: hypothetical protein M3O20_12775 [Acidobacteriota bacterium]|nr:hypothetical protein [Acidobacteriota bacterium]